MKTATDKTKKARPELIEKGQGKRLLEIIAKKNIKSRSAFARAVGVSSSSINEIIWNLKEIKENLQSKILVAFPDIDMNWLLTGKSTELLTIKSDEHGVNEGMFGVYMECERYKLKQKRANKMCLSFHQVQIKKPVSCYFTGSLNPVGVI